MATSVPEQVCTNTQVWSNTALRINELFDKIIWNANTRRNQLLKELEEIKSSFEAKNRSVENSITELEKLVRSMEETGLRENLAVETLKESLTPIKKRIQSLQSSNPTLEFKYSCNYDLLSEISRLGTFVGDTDLYKNDPIDYKRKINSFRTFGTKGSSKRELNSPQEIHFDSESNTLFIVDLGNHCVKLFGIEGNFISQFGQNVLEGPCGIATDGVCFFITDVRVNSLFKFKKTDYSFVKRANGLAYTLKYPMTVKVFEGEVFVVEKLNHKVSVFNLNLNFKREIGVGRFLEPKTLEIYKGELYVLDKREGNNLYVFTPAGEFLRASSSGLKDPAILCFDRDGNMILTDYSTTTGAIKVFSPTGDLIHQIGKGVPGTEAIGLCTGIALSGDSIIVVVHSPDHCIRFF